MSSTIGCTPSNHSTLLSWHRNRRVRRDTSQHRRHVRKSLSFCYRHQQWRRNKHRKFHSKTMEKLPAGCRRKRNSATRRSIVEFFTSYRSSSTVTAIVFFHFENKSVQSAFGRFFHHHLFCCRSSATTDGTINEANNRNAYWTKWRWTRTPRHHQCQRHRSVCNSKRRKSQITAERIHGKRQIILLIVSVRFPARTRLENHRIDAHNRQSPLTASIHGSSSRHVPSDARHHGPIPTARKHEVSSRILEARPNIVRRVREMAKRNRFFERAKRRRQKSTPT